MSSIYSERFLQVAADLTWVSYTVPPGRRAVIKAVTVANNSGSSAKSAVYLAGLVLAMVSSQAYSTVNVAPSYAVAYANESFQAQAGASGVCVTISGYEFDDPSGRVGPAGELDEAADPPVGWSS